MKDTTYLLVSGTLTLRAGNRTFEIRVVACPNVYPLWAPLTPSLCQLAPVQTAWWSLASLHEEKNVRSKRKSQQIANNANNGYITTYSLEVSKNMSLRCDTFSILLIIIKKAPTVFPSVVRIFLTKDNTLSLTPTCILDIPSACFHWAHLISVAPLMKGRLT